MATSVQWASLWDGSLEHNLKYETGFLLGDCGDLFMPFKAVGNETDPESEKCSGEPTLPVPGWTFDNVRQDPAPHRSTPATADVY